MEAEQVWTPSERVATVFALAAVAFVALAATGTFPWLGPPLAGATQYCTQYQYQPQYQYNNCAPPLVPPLIAFDSNRDGVGNTEVYVMNTDGSRQTRLWANTNANDGNPSWSPDGQKLAFETNRDGLPQIYLMNVDGNGQTRLTSGAANVNPAWSADGTKIAFVSVRDGNTEVYVMNADGSSQTRLTNNTTVDFAPTWSPDGTKIAFSSLRDGNLEIYAMNADGSGQTRLTNNPAGDLDPDWSPNGQRIVFTTSRDGNPEIYAMNGDGSAPTRLTNNPSAESRPSWSPDGQKLVFTTSRDGQPEIYVMNADGSSATRLTTNPAFDTSPDWQPAAAPPANSCGNTQGNGILGEDPKSKLKFNVRSKAGSSAPTGSVSVNDAAAQVTFDSTQIATFSISGDDATATGSGVANGQPVTFTLRIHDDPDSFSLELSSGYTRGGALRSGRIEIHPSCS